MKTKSFILFALLISRASFAQLSQSGMPISFDKHFQGTALFKFENMPAFDLQALIAEDAVNDLSKGPFRFGFNHFVNYNLNNSGVWTALPDGGRLWQLGLKSAGALSLNLAFDDYFLPEGGKLFVYTADKKFVYGAFTNKNNDASNAFATDLIPGDALVIEYYEPAGVANTGRLNLFRVTHGYRGVKEFAEKSFGGAGSCQVNVNCPLGANWQNEKRGVVCLVVGGSEFCSGSLINDVPQDAKPYVLTANHCSTSNDMATWVFRFNWEAPGCTNPGTSPSTTQSLSTSTLRARNAASDFCLVEITGGLVGGTVPAAYTPYFNGWSNVNVAASSVTGIHHPSGDIKKISEALNAVSTATFGSPSADTWQVGQWTTACTEPGSSGSPLFDQNHRIVGQLFGGPSACGATAPNMHDNYGKFATSWLGGGTSSTQLKVWLDPNSIGDTTLNGYDPYSGPPAFAFDAGVQSISAPANAYSSCNTFIVPALMIHNFGADTLIKCVINYKIDNDTVHTYHWTGSLSTNASAAVTIASITGLSVGNHTFTAYTTLPNDSTEQDTPNDTSVSTFSVITASPIVNLPQTEDFQTAFPVTNWAIGNPDANATWTKVTTAGGFGTSTSSAKMDNFSNNIVGQSDFIYSGYLNLSAVLPPISLSFDVAYACYDANTFDSLKIDVSNDCGTDWTTIYAKAGAALATAPNTTNAFTPTASQWRTDYVNLDNYAGQAAVRIAFENKSDYGQNIYIDNINLANSALSIPAVDFSAVCSIYPNPGNGEFNIAVKNASADAVTVKVMNVLGSVVLLKTFQNAAEGLYPIDIKQEAAGIYFIEIAAGNEKTVKKINMIR